MSTEEQASVIGRAVLDHAESKKRLSLLLAKGERWGKLMRSIGGVIGTPENEYYSNIRNGSKLPDLSEYPSREDLERLQWDILAEQETKRNLGKQLAEIGYAPKD